MSNAGYLPPNYPATGGLVVPPPANPDTGPLRVEQLAEQVLASTDAINKFLELASSPRTERRFRGRGTGTTDVSGNVTINVYENSDGFELNLTSLSLEADGYTPAAPYSNASFWAGVYVSADPTNTAQGLGGLVDFTPATAGGAGIPAVTFYPGNAGATLIGHEWLVVDMNAGPPSKLIVVRFEGIVRQIR